MHVLLITFAGVSIWLAGASLNNHTQNLARSDRCFKRQFIFPPELCLYVFLYFIDLSLSLNMRDGGVERERRGNGKGILQKTKVIVLHPESL